MSEPLYRIRPLRWKRDTATNDPADGYILRANGASIDFQIQSVAYRRYLRDAAESHLERPAYPTWTAHFDERNYQGPTQCRTIAECKAAVDKVYRDVLRGDLIEHWMRVK